MSDNEYSGSDNSDSDSDSENVITTSNKTPLFKIAIKKNIGSYTYKEKDDADADDSDSDNSDIGDEAENKINKDYNEEEDGESSEDDHLDDDTDDEKDDKSNVDDNDVVEVSNLLGNVSVSKNQKPKKLQPVIMSNDDDDDDDEYEENYLHKFDTEIIKNYVNEFHPECLNHNYEEIEKMSRIIRNSDGIIIDPLHKTIPYLTKYEKARILGQRSKQIETGAKPLVKVPENIVDSYIIAELELKEKKIPFIIRRPIPGGACEYWHLKDLENISF